MKRILFLLTLLLLFSGCKDNTKFTVNGLIRDTKEKYIYVKRLDIDTPVLIDSAKINRKGIFRLKVKASGPDFYQLGYSSSNFITLLAEPGEKIKLLFNDKNLFEHFSVSGSVGSEKLQTLDLNLSETKRKLDSLSTLYTKSSVEPGFEVKGPLLQAEFQELIKAQRKKNIEFIIKNLNSLASIKALYQKINPETYVLYDAHDLQFLKIVTDSLTHHYPNSKQVQALARDFEKEMNQMYVNKINQLTKNIPQTKLDPDLKNISDNRIALSSLRGKYVLLTFWSVNSKDCIDENLQLKEFYKLYNKKGFEIYQINLDENESAWKAAVRFDELPWISTREDDPKNPRNAMLFNVKSLPSNYLFDKESKIIASNIHGKTLLLKLEQLFNK
ncbi:MAG TPA: TlpA disulfide reductase family protein [Bacteroidales bacterium]